MKIKYSKIKILERIKEANNIIKDTYLADFLGISRATVSNWSKRDSIDYELVFSKCEHLNLDWIITGRGYKLLPDEAETLVSNIKVASEKESIFYEMYKEKELENKELLKEIGRLEEKVRYLEENNNTEKYFDKNTSPSCLQKKNPADSANVPLKPVK